MNNGDYCIYLRKSRADIEAEKRGEGETLARHRSMLMDIAQKRDFNIVKIYKEIVSGESIASRPQMQEMLKEISEGRYAGVLVAEVERLARGDTIDQGVVAQAFRESGTKIITPVKTYDPNNEFDEEYFEFSLFMSRREYKTIRRRMQAGRLASVKEGNYIVSSEPYGYRKISPEPKVHTLEIVPDEAEIVRLIYNLYLEGHGAKYIAEYLNRLGVAPKKSDFWESPSIKKILSNPLYCGKLCWKTKSNGNTLYQGRHEPVVSEEIFNQVQEKRKNNPNAQVRTDDTLKNYYHNILYCKNCGHQMKRRFIPENGQQHILCTYRQCRGKVVSASFREVDEAVMSAFRYRIKYFNEITKNMNSPENPPDSTPDRRTPLLAQLEKAEKQKSKLYDLLEQEVYDIEIFLERSEAVNSKIDAIKNSLSEIDSAEEQVRLSPEESVSRLEYLLENFPTATPLEKIFMLKRVARKIYYSKTKRMCRYKFDSDISIEVDFL